MKNKLWVMTVLVLLASVSQSQEVTYWRGGTNGVYPDTGLLNEWPENGPEVIWSFEGLAQGFSSPVFALDHIFISTMLDKTGFIFVLDMNGQEVNRYPYGEEFFESFPGTRSSPVVVGNWLYIYSGKGVVYAFDALSGEKKWEKKLLQETDGENIRWGVTETLVVDGDRVYCSPGGKEYNVVALNRITGEYEWISTGTGGLSAYCTPALFHHNGRKLLVTMMEKHVIGLDPENGKLLWSYDQPNKWSVHANTPLYVDGLLINSSGYGHGTSCLKLSDDGSSYSELWFLPELDNRMGGIVTLDGYIYGSGDNNREWRCVDLKTGKTIWESTEVGKGVVIAADGKLYIYSDRGELAMARASSEGFKLLSKTKVELGTAQHWAHPVIKDGKLYLRHGDTLICYKIR